MTQIDIVNRSIDLARYREHDQNYNQHSNGQIDDLRLSLRKFGQVRSVVVQDDGASGFIGVAGHGVVRAAIAQGMTEVRADVIPATWKPEQVLAYLATDNETARASQPDDARLAAIVAELQDVDGELARLAAGTEERLKELLAMLKDPPEDPGPQIDKAEELREKWGVETGQLWQLGDHRLICGDCTDAAVVNAVAFGDRIDLWVTDPPYGVSYADKNKYLNAVAKGNSIQVPIEGDHLTLDEATDLWKRAFSIVFEIAKPGYVYYVHAPQGGDLMMMMMMLRESGWLLKPQIIWSKNNHVLGRSDYQLKHEPILYGWKEGSHFWCGSRSEMSVWQIDKPQNSDFHPTTKPVELAEKAIQNSSQSNEIVFDGFLGSGTTMVAAHRLGRRCFGVELTPGYCAVTLERMAGLGVTPVLIDSLAATS